MRKLIRKIVRWIYKILPEEKPQVDSHNSKYDAEVNYWKKSIRNYIKWFKGEIKEMHGEVSPSDNIKSVIGLTDKDKAILTWFEVHQKVKYLEDLELSEDVFSGLRVLDVGSGPMPSGLAFKDIDLYCLDPLLSRYIDAGFPIHYYGDTKFIQSFAERTPFPDNFFDVVISVNAIDHVDNFEETVTEISRILKPTGKLRLHIHYHKATKAEPIELNDDRVRKAFSWDRNFKKIKESQKKRGTELTKSTDVYTVWSNF